MVAHEHGSPPAAAASTVQALALTARTVVATMKSRSLIIDICADYVRHRGGEIAALALTQLVEACGVPQATARVTLSRMHRSGSLASRRNGRLSYYSPTPPLLELIERSEARIMERHKAPWDGRWDMVVYSIPEAERHRRDYLRSQLEWLGYGQLVAGCWVSPHRRNADVFAVLDGRHRITTEEIELFEVASAGPERDASMAARCWQLDDLNEAYRAFHDRRQRDLDRIRHDGISDEAAFVERVLLVAEYRKYPFRDPDLPTELLPVDWIGRSAHGAFVELREVLRVGAFRHYDRVSRLEAPKAVAR